MTAVEVFASYSPRHRRDLSPILVALRDRLLAEMTEPRHRAEASR